MMRTGEFNELELAEKSRFDSMPLAS